MQCVEKMPTYAQLKRECINADTNPRAGEEQGQAVPFIQQLQQQASHPSGGTKFLLSACVFELGALKLLRGGSCVDGGSRTATV